MSPPLPDGSVTCGGSPLAWDAMTPRQLNMYAWTSFMWGASFYCLAIAIPEFGWAGTVSLRAFAASAILVLVAVATWQGLGWPLPGAPATATAAPGRARAGAPTASAARMSRGTSTRTAPRSGRR